MGLGLESDKGSDERAGEEARAYLSHARVAPGGGSG